MIRKIQAQKNMRFVFIPRAYVELLDLKKSQKVDVRVENGNIIIIPINNNHIKTDGYNV